jgi:4-oxalomesaconate tautomerase
VPRKIFVEPETAVERFQFDGTSITTSFGTVAAEGKPRDQCDAEGLVMKYGFEADLAFVRALEAEIACVTIFMENTGQVAVATVATPGGVVTYDGDARIDGVPGTAAAVPLEFRDTAGSSCGALLPTGNAVDVIEGVACTLIDNGMPCIILKAVDVGATGYEDRDTLDAADAIKAKIEAIRLQGGPMMNLGDVASKSVPKIMLVAPPRRGGAVTVRSFIPKRAHASIGVLGAVSVATACLIPGSTASEVARVPDGARKTLSVEHPTGEMTCVLETDEAGEVVSVALLRTARKLMDGVVFG